MKASRGETTLSRLGAGRGALLVAAVLLLLHGCASKQDEEVRKLQAKATYEQAVRNLTENRLALGMAALKEALQLDPDNAQYHNTLGLVLLNLGRPVDGQAEFQTAIDLDKTSPDIQHNLGIALAQQSRFEDAVAAYKKALTFPDFISMVSDS